MTLTTVKIAGCEALAALEVRRAVYPTSGQYPFLIGDSEELERIQEAAERNGQLSRKIVQASRSVDLDQWIGQRRAEAEEYDFSVEETLGEWHGEVADKGTISLHKDIVSGEIKQEIYLGIATIEHPWRLPAVLRYGAWNECPEPEVHCAFHRKWQSEFGAQITGMSGDVVECVVNNPPRDQQSAVELAWQ